MKRNFFQTLYHLITFGAFDPFLDDWNNFMRIGLVCDLLMTCGEFFNGSAAKRRLDCFLIYFYRYVWAKKDACALRDLSFPSEVILFFFDSLIEGWFANRKWFFLGNFFLNFIGAISIGRNVELCKEVSENA